MEHSHDRLGRLSLFALPPWLMPRLAFPREELNSTLPSFGLIVLWSFD